MSSPPSSKSALRA